ncbi:MAG: hypothetical protein AAGI38_19340 [Bacteroidota bacterium]
MLTLAIFLNAAALLGMLAWRARRNGREVTFWLSLCVLVWGFIWVGESYLNRYLRNYYEDWYPHKWTWVMGASALSVLAYLLIWFQVGQPNEEDDLAKKVEEIGKREGESSS